jgi:hypothetical protein
MLRVWKYCVIKGHVRTNTLPIKLTEINNSNLNVQDNTKYSSSPYLHYCAIMPFKFIYAGPCFRHSKGITAKTHWNYKNYENKEG